jgi:acylphosphatase
MASRRRALFSGQVQGVGFRYTAHSIARRHGVSGYVRNLPDGSVELVMEGEEPQMQQVLLDIGERMKDYIRERKDDLSAATGEFKDFSIRH